MTDLVLVNGERLTRFELHVPAQGPWFAECDFESEAPGVAVEAVIRLGELELHGTVAPRHAGTFGLSKRARIVAGGGGWGTLIPARGYRNDAGIKARTIAEDAAREAGETLGDFAPRFERVGAHYLRRAGAAATALESAAGGVSWWVGYDGLTHVGERATAPAAPGKYQVQDYDPRARVARLTVDDPSVVSIGSVLSTDDLPEPITVRELTLIVDGDSGFEVHAWAGDDPRGRLAGAFRRLVERATDGRLFGRYRYRIESVTGDRWNLQVVDPAPGLPDAVGVHVETGVPATVEPELGAEVSVAFLAGSPTAPIVVGFAPGHVHNRTIFGDPAAAADAARNGDPVEVVLPPAVFSGTIGGSPASGVLTFLTNKALGVITGGSGKVGIG